MTFPEFDISLSVSDLGFVVFVAAAVLAYFVLPKKYRWTALLAASLAFYILSDLRCLLFLLITSISVYILAIELETVAQKRDEALAAAEKPEKKLIRKKYKTRQRLIIAAAAALNIGLLAGMKYSGIFSEVFSFKFTGFLAISSGKGLIMPLGISFYTFQALGYLIDVYNGKVTAEGSYAKFLLFVSFFPQIIQGPISRFDKLSPQLYEGHSFDYFRFRSGMELVLWGYFKKLVVADRIYHLVSGSLEIWHRMPGIMLLFVMVMYSVQLYADFSGGIDISRGICEILGIELTPNFRQPYLSRSLSEFWRRWHITLGAWFKDYVFFPLATSGLYNRLSRLLRKKLSRTTADRICSSLVSIFTFTLIGIWHGAEFGYILYGLWHGCLIAIATMTTDLSAGLLKKLRISPENKPFNCFRVVRTYVLVLTGFFLVLLPSVSQSFQVMAKIFTDPLPTFNDIMNSLYAVTFSKDLPVALFGTAVMIVSGILAACGRDIRRDVNSLPLGLQWAFLITGICLVVIFGCYGDGYDATSFIYQVF